MFFGGAVFGVFAATYYWFPKMTGRKLNEPLGKVHFWMHFIGFNLAFFPMHPLASRACRAASPTTRPTPAGPSTT